MEHTVAIWSNRKERNDEGKLDFIIEQRVTVTQEQIEEFVLKEFLEYGYSVNDDREYKAEIEETKH